MASGAELIRQIKERIQEVDPREVHDLLAADTLKTLLGYEDVVSMTGGITLWKDRGYDVDVPRALTPEQRTRYSRHLLIPEIGLEGQLKLLDSKVLLLGAGGLGSPAALYLAAAGVDNFPTRYPLNDATVRLEIPVVSASILGFDGQLSVFAPYEGPCYRCLYPTPPPAELAPSCGANGVLGVLPGTIGLLLYDALAATTTELKVRRDPECPICSRDPESISEDEMGVFPDYEAFCAGAG